MKAANKVGSSYEVKYSDSNTSENHKLANSKVVMTLESTKIGDLKFKIYFYSPFHYCTLWFEEKNQNYLLNFSGKGNSTENKKIKIPAPIERSIQKQNVRFLHHRNQYTHEYFQFMRKIINANSPYVNNEKLSTEAEELAMLTVQLASKFLFNSGFHTKKSLRGSAQEWYELLTLHLR